MSNLILMDNYFNILQEVGRWKVIAIKDLYQSLKDAGSYSMFTIRVNKLEREGFLKSITGSNRRKYVHLTREGSMFSPVNIPVIDSITLNHDLLVSSILNKLLDHPVFYKGHIAHTDHEDKIDPDAIIYGIKKGIEFKMAIEAELTQKSKKRVAKKFNLYAKDDEYDYCLYVFSYGSVYRAYKKVAYHLDESVRSKIILLLDERLSKDSFNYLDAECYFNSKEMKFREIIE